MNNISLAKFLSRYLGVVGEETKYLTHEDIKYMFPYLKRASFSYIENNPGRVLCGEILLVNDGKKTIPYYTPKLEMDNSINELNHEKAKPLTVETPDFTGMKIYELRKLLNVRFNGYHNSRAARRELEDRGVVLNKKYNREEFKKWRKDYERD